MPARCDYVVLRKDVTIHTLSCNTCHHLGSVTCDRQLDHSWLSNIIIWNILYDKKKIKNIKAHYFLWIKNSSFEKIIVFWQLEKNMFKLDMNCDFSSNNNIWARFYEFLWRPFRILLGYFYYDRFIGILCVSFLAAILNCNFRLQTSDCKFQKSPLSFNLMLYHYPRC